MPLLAAALTLSTSRRINIRHNLLGRNVVVVMVVDVSCTQLSLRHRRGGSFVSASCGVEVDDGWEVNTMSGTHCIYVTAVILL